MDIAEREAEIALQTKRALAGMEADINAMLDVEFHQHPSRPRASPSRFAVPSRRVDQRQQFQNKAAE